MPDNRMTARKDSTREFIRKNNLTEKETELYLCMKYCEIFKVSSGVSFPKPKTYSIN